jgi:hypothetical protein
VQYNTTLLYPPAQKHRRRTPHRKKQNARPESPTTPDLVIAGVEKLFVQEAEEQEKSVRHLQMRIRGERTERDIQRESEDKERREREAEIRAAGAEDGWDKCGNKLLDIYGATDSFPAYSKLLCLFIVALPRLMSRRRLPAAPVQMHIRTFFISKRYHADHRRLHRRRASVPHACS